MTYCGQVLLANMSAPDKARRSPRPCRGGGLSVARATGAGFEWQDHVQHALAVGLPQDIVDGIAAGGAAALPHPFGLLREVFDQDSCLAADPEALQAQAATKWGTDGLVEIVMVSGFYQMFAAINQGFNICRHHRRRGAGENLSVQVNTFTFAAIFSNSCVY